MVIGYSGRRANSIRDIASACPVATARPMSFGREELEGGGAGQGSGSTRERKIGPWYPIRA